MDATQLAKLEFSVAAGRRASGWKLAAKLGLAFAAFAMAGELASRAYWAITKGMPPFTLRPGWFAYYPQLSTSGVLNKSGDGPSDTFDVLILGGSTISDQFGTIGPRLARSLQPRVGRPVRVYNLACYAHTSRDSVLKYRLLAQRRFDLVVVYDGINDARMNHAPPERFRDDYRHCRWYETLRFVERRPWISSLALVFTGKFALDRFAESTGLTWYLPRHAPGEELMEHACAVRSREAFRRNYEEIVTTAAARGDRLLLMTFAYHIPADYTRERCLSGVLDYGNGCPEPVELWGRPDNVAKAVDAHNEVLRELASVHSEVVFVDQFRRLARGAATFNDCCHLTDEGCRLFVENILAALNASS
jgi:hypothetical protein